MIDVTTRCTKVPDGWGCSREKGHDGPCAAYQLKRKYEYSILELCEKLHMANTGAGDLTTDEFNLYILTLQDRLDKWIESSSEYDEIIHSLIVKTLKECFENRNY